MQVSAYKPFILAPNPTSNVSPLVQILLMARAATLMCLGAWPLLRDHMHSFIRNKQITNRCALRGVLRRQVPRLSWDSSQLLIHQSHMSRHITRCHRWPARRSGGILQGANSCHGAYGRWHFARSNIGSRLKGPPEPQRTPQVPDLSTVAALIIEVLGTLFSVGKIRKPLRLLCFFPQQILTQVVQCLAPLRYASQPNPDSLLVPLCRSYSGPMPGGIGSMPGGIGMAGSAGVSG
jgi:hypothetical protein